MSKEESIKPILDSEKQKKVVGQERQQTILPLAKDSIVFGNTTTNKQQKSQEQASDNVTSNLDKILEMMRQEIIGKQNLLFQEILLNIQEEEEQKKYIKGLSPQEFKTELQNNPNLEEQIKSVLASKTENGIDFKNRLEQIESQGYTKVHEQFKDDFREIPWNADIGVSDLRSTEIKNESGEVLCDLSEQIVSNKKTDVKLSNGETISVSSYRQIDFPQSLKPDTTGPMHLSMAVKDEKGHNIAEKDAVYFSAHYNEQGKLVEVSSPQPVKFAGKGDDAIGYIEKDGKIYTLPVTKGKYQMMQQEVQKNQGQSINLASTLESNIEPELAKTQDVYNFKQEENIRTKEQDKDNPSLSNATLQDNGKQNKSRPRSNAVSLSKEDAEALRQKLGVKKEKSTDEKVANFFGDKGLQQYKDKLNQAESIEGRDSSLSEPVSKQEEIELQELEKKPSIENILNDSIKMRSGSEDLDDFDKVINVDSTRRNASLLESSLKKEVFKPDLDKISSSTINPELSKVQEVDNSKLSDQADSRLVDTENINKVELTEEQVQIELQKLQQEIDLENSNLSQNDTSLLRNVNKLFARPPHEEEALDKELNEIGNQILQEGKNKNIQAEVSVEGSKQNKSRPRSNAVSLSKEDAEALRQKLGVKQEKSTDEKLEKHKDHSSLRNDTLQNNDKQKNEPIKELKPKAKENNVKHPPAHNAERQEIRNKVLALSNNREYSDKNGKLNSKGQDQKTLIVNKKRIDIESKKILETLQKNPTYKNNDELLTYKNNDELLKNRFEQQVKLLKKQIIHDENQKLKDNYIKSLTQGKKEVEVKKDNTASKNNIIAAMRKKFENFSKNPNPNPNPVVKNNNLQTKNSQKNKGSGHSMGG